MLKSIDASFIDIKKMEKVFESINIHVKMKEDWSCFVTNITENHVELISTPIEWNQIKSTSMANGMIELRLSLTLRSFSWRNKHVSQCQPMKENKFYDGKLTGQNDFLSQKIILS